MAAERLRRYAHPLLNDEKDVAPQSITPDVYSGAHGAHFIGGPGGSGETFLYNVLLEAVRSRGLGGAAVASSGIAAFLLEGGRAAPSKLKLPIQVTKESA